MVASMKATNKNTFFFSYKLNFEFFFIYDLLQVHCYCYCWTSLDTCPIYTVYSTIIVPQMDYYIDAPSTIDIAIGPYVYNIDPAKQHVYLLHR